MMLSRNTYLADIPADSYVSEDNSELCVHGWTVKNTIDCSLGTNPFGTPEKAREAFGTAAKGLHLSSYPEPWAQALQEALLEYWPDAGLTVDNIVLGAGSMGILQQYNTLFLAPGARLLGIAPQFADYVRSAQVRGAKYEAVTLQLPELRISLEKLLERLDQDIAAIYLDNPNNPTGQVLPLAKMEAIAAQALNCNTALIVDEAYGDFMPNENSAINLITRYPNVAVARSFSKGWGLAGLRVGYGVISTEIKKLYDKIDMPFNIVDPAVTAACAALAQPDFLTFSRKKVAQVKKQIKQSLTCLIMSYTHDTTPIMTLTAPNPDIDLRQQFLRQGVLVVDGAEFSGLTSASVRLRVPADGNALVQRLQAVEQSL
ncbi:MAG TPA: histidinol-phosphate aminotransferase family protein [Firmicutes bacterium]|nr:histidinol-phosphate aminotransferase family protein [Bacillota bacterium]